MEEGINAPCRFFCNSMPQPCHCLPRLLDSIAAQSFQQTEVIIVDDGSTESCLPVVEAYSQKGMNIRLVAPKNRLYTLQARLAGVREAAGEIIAFADADDMLWGTTALEEHVRLFYEHKADVVHFRSVITDASGAFTGYFPQADPWAPTLSGNSIFQFFLESGLEGYAIWNKLIARKLLLANMEALHSFSVQRYMEDFFFNFFITFHATQYVGSERIGYGYNHYTKKHADRFIYKAVALVKISKELSAYITPLVQYEHALPLLHKKLAQLICLYVGRGCIAFERDEINIPSEQYVLQLLQQVSTVELVQTLLIGNRLNAEKIVTTAKVALGL